MRLLVIEDEKRLARNLAELLRRQGYTVDVSSDGVSGYDNASTDLYDLILLDAMLPGMDGFTLLRKLRAGGHAVPVLMLTARSDLSDRVQGLDCGADYYLTKPFEPEELLACVRSLLRRGGGDARTDDAITFGDLRLEPGTFQLSCGERSLRLSRREYDMLELLLRSQGRVVPKEQLLLKVWGYDSDAEDNNVEVYTSFLRRKLTHRHPAVTMAMWMALVLAVLLAVFVGVLVSSRAAVERTVNQRLMQVVQTGRYDASLPGEGSAAPCFVADVYPSGTVRLSGSSYYRLDDQDAMADIVTACLEQGDSSGILRSYHLRYLRADGPLYTRIAFTDAAQEDATLRAVVKMCLLVGAAALAVLLGCSYLLAGLAARPVARSLDQQRRFLSDASHELKTPLTVILSSADLMQQTAVQPDQQPYVDNIRWSGRRMKRLVEDMLTLSRADDGRLKAAMVPVDLSDAVVDTALRFEPVAFEAGRQLSYDIDEGITVTGSRDQLQQVAGVLLDNAIKYAPQGAGVHMTLTQAERKAVLTVENGGPPIPPEVLPHLFDRFYRADGSRTQGGFGLGLSIAQAIVREHKGTIRCESDRRSTRFIVTLPAGGKK